VSERRHLTKKVLRFAIASALLGLFIAAAFATYFEVADPPPDTRAALWSGLASLVLCPGTFFFWWFIDAEPGTSGFVFMWVIVGLSNACLYGLVGAFVGIVLELLRTPGHKEGAVRRGIH
jgi:hypothetical protein